MNQAKQYTYKGFIIVYSDLGFWLVYGYRNELKFKASTLQEATEMIDNRFE